MASTLSESNDTLPFSMEAEKAVLGGVFGNQDSLYIIEDMLTPDHFFLDAHKKIFESILELSGQGDVPDIVTVAEKLRREKGDRHYLGAGYLAELTECAPISENIEDYAGIVRSCFFRRKIISACQETIAGAKSFSGDVTAFVEGLEKEFLEITGNYDRSGLIKVDRVVESTLEDLERKISTDGVTTGVPTGFDDLDRLTGGLQPSDLIILAARPGMGKTALVLNIATNAALANKSAVVFTLEMSKEQLMVRVLSSLARVESTKMGKGDLSQDELDRLMESARKLHDYKDYLAIDETPGISLMELRSRCRRYAKENGVDLIVIDYLQLMSLGGGKVESREREISQISMGLKQLAKELRVPVVALAQLNRGPDARPDKRPKISDLRESGSMEQDADLILFVYRDEYYNPDSESAGVSEVIVGKNRHGETTTIKLAFQPNYVSFHNLYKGGN